MAHFVSHWKDKEPTGAEGWLVIDRLINGASGGGLFMHPEASMGEVKDLARSMSYKNTLQTHPFGGGKAGVRYDHEDQRAPDVLRRFIIAHGDIINRSWSTGADLNTDNHFILKVIREDCGLSSAFTSIGRMLRECHGFEDQSHCFEERISLVSTPHFTLGSGATGFSVACALERVLGRGARVVIQGFGKVGRSLAYYLQARKIAKVVGISDIDGYISHRDGIEVEEIFPYLRQAGGDSPGLVRFLPESIQRLYHAVVRPGNCSDEDFLNSLLKTVPFDVFSPCAKRYVVTPAVVRNLIELSSQTAPIHIISGANNVFVNQDTMRSLMAAGLRILPEWVSNSGNALLFLEALKASQIRPEQWPDQVLGIIENRVTSFIDHALARCRGELGQLYAHCRRLAEQKLKGAQVEMGCKIVTPKLESLHLMDPKTHSIL